MQEWRARDGRNAGRRARFLAGPLFVFVVFCATSGAAAAKSGEAASISMAPAGGDWRVEYSLKKPALALTLVRPSESDRGGRIRFDDPAFELVVDGESTVIRRKDGVKFDRVAFAEPAAYFKEFVGYLPFSPFGDGGLLVYSGRYHACAGECPTDKTGNEGPWRLRVDPKGKRMIVAGKVVSRATSFKDFGDGASIYVGDGAIANMPSYLAVLDQALPANIRAPLDDFFPKLMAYYAERLGKPAKRPMMFVSYDVPGVIEGYSIKGGTLPDQVFMHFEGAGVEKLAAKPNFGEFLAWFFAHEAGHLHQWSRYAQSDDGDSWIHEGGADAFAYLALKDLGAAQSDYLRSRVRKAEAGCKASLAIGPLHEAAARGDFDAFYACGLIMQLVVDAGARRTGGDLFSVWRDFDGRIAKGASWNTETFLAVIEAQAGADTASLVRGVLASAPQIPSDLLRPVLGDDAESEAE